MSKKRDWKPEELESKVHDLAESMSRVRSAQAERDDVVVDLKEAKLSRLELLAKDLKDVIRDIPKDSDLFEFGLSKGETPRLWVDVTSFVRLVADGREYEFVKDTYMGRVVLGRTENRELIGKHVTDYVAERILERERAIEGEWVTAQTLLEIDAEENAQPETTEQASDQQPSVNGFGWFVAGLLLPIAGVFALAAFDQLQPAVDWFINLFS